MLVLLVMMRLLDAEDYGLVAYAMVIRAFGELFVTQGMSEAIVQRKNLENEHIDSVFWLQTAVSALVAAGMVFGAPALATLLKQPEIEPLLRWLALGPVLAAACTIQAALLKRDLKFKQLAFRDIVANVAGGITGVVLAFKGAGVWALVWQMLTTRIVTMFVLWAATSWRPRLVFSWLHCKQMLSFSLHTGAVNLMNFANTRFDQLIIGYVLGEVALGYYAVGTALMRQIVMMFNGVIHQVALPVFSKVQDDHARLGRGLYEVMQMSAVVILPIGATMIVAGELFITEIFGIKWLPSVPVFQWFALTGTVGAVLSMTTPALLAVGRADIRTKVYIFNTIASLVTVVLVVPWGIVAVAAGNAVRIIVSMPIPLTILHRLIHLSVRRLARHLAAPLTGAVLLAVTVLAARYTLSTMVEPWMMLLICIVVAAAVYTGTVWWLDRGIFDRVGEMIQSIRQKRRRAEA